MSAIDKLTQTKDVYSFLLRQGNSSLPLDLWHFNDMQDIVPESIVRGKIGLEAGSGRGYDTHIMARNNPHVTLWAWTLAKVCLNQKRSMLL